METHNKERGCKHISLKNKNKTENVEKFQTNNMKAK